MIKAVRSELLKLRTTRLWWGMAIAIFVAGALFAALFGFLYTMDMGATPQDGMTVPMGDDTQIANSVYTAGLSVGYLLLLTIGVMQVGSEYRHKTITGTFLAVPKRGRALLAKVVALVVIGVGYGLVSLLGSVSVGAAVLSARGVDPFPSVEVLRSLALSLLALSLWALIGLGVGILIPNMVAALLIGIGFAWIVEPILSFGLSFWDFSREHVVKFLPSQATNAMIDPVTMSGPGAVEPLSWWAGALVLTAYAAVLAGLGVLRAARQDVA
jgi:ABC-2 type transport system permease protein